MTVTRLKRKDRKNLARAVNKTRVIKQMLFRPVIKQVNLEELTAKYGSSAGAATVVAAPVAAAPAAPAKPAPKVEVEETALAAPAVETTTATDGGDEA